MAAVASGHYSHAPGFYRPENMAEHRPSFTAVNGAPGVVGPPGSNPSPAPSSNREGARAPSNPASTPYEAPRPSNETSAADAGPRGERREDAILPPIVERRMSAAPPGSGGPPPAGTPVLASPSTLQRPPTQPPPSQLASPEQQRLPHPAEYYPSGPEPPRPATGNQNDPATPQPTASALMSPQKRKRSLSIERETSRQPSSSQPAPMQNNAEARVVNGVEPGPEQFSPKQTYPPPPPPPHANIYQQPQQDPYRQAPPPHPYPPPLEQNPNSAEPYARPNGVARNEYGPPLDPSIAPAQERPYYTDESRLAEALQRENRSYDNAPRRDSYPPPEDEDDEEQQQQYTTYGGSREAGTTDSERKRRKRVFSNRTKTGCMTCRRRKKKCDELHPECNNCLRGGFVCEGYTIRNTWQKPANSKQPVPLQSKNGYPSQESTPTRAPYPPMNRYPDNGAEYPPQPSMPAPHGYEPKRGSISDHESVYGRNSPPTQKGQPAWSKGPANRPYPNHPPAASKYQGDEHRGSIYDMGQDRDETGPMPPPPVHRTGSAQSQYSQPGHPPSHNTTPPHQHAQAAAQAALTHTSSRTPQNRSQNTEREKMLKGMYYHPSSPALTEDRERCIAAIWRFNNATNPAHGASPEERIRLFRQILSQKPSPEPPLSTGEAPTTSMTMPVGSCGERVIVEAPFHCDYGYNITVGDDVLIGADCRISDTCSVTIGARCILSPNVKLICATYPIDPKRRQGSHGPALGRNIVIEEDCWIGAGVTILAGVRVGKNSTVGAGSLLHSDVPRYTVVAGNPAKVSRGIYDEQ